MQRCSSKLTSASGNKLLSLQLPDIAPAGEMQLYVMALSQVTTLIDCVQCLVELNVSVNLC